MLQTITPLRPLPLGMIMSNFGIWLRDARGKMTLEEFADLLDTSHSTISRYENSEKPPKRSTVKRYAETLNKNVNEALIAAGYLPEGEVESKVVTKPDHIEMVELYEGLTQPERSYALEMMRKLGEMRRAGRNDNDELVYVEADGD